MSQSDNPIAFSTADTDWLDRRAAVTALRRLLEEPSLGTPLVVGIYGSWGTGKTSLMRTLAADLAAPDRLMLWFDAWIYARQEEALWRALLLRVVEALREMLDDLPEFQSDAHARKAVEAELEEARASLYRSLISTQKGRMKVNWGNAAPIAADALLSAITAGFTAQLGKLLSGKDVVGGIASAVASWLKDRDTKEALKLIEREETERYVEQIVSLEQFRETFQKLLTRFKIGTERTFFVFIDDLDRCLPENAVTALEAVKLFLDFEGCVFVLGMDRDVIEQGIRVRYRDLGPEASFDPRQYLDKVIQIPFTLPLLGRHQVAHYLAQLSRHAERDVASSACSDLILVAAPPNPRALKRILNTLQLTLYLDDWDMKATSSRSEREQTARVRYIAKIVLLQVVFDQAYRQLRENPLSIRDIEDTANRKKNDAVKFEALPTIWDDPRVQSLLQRPPWFHELSDDEIEGLLTLSRATGST